MYYQIVSKFSKRNCLRNFSLNEKFPEQIKEAEKIMQEDRDVLHELARR